LVFKDLDIFQYSGVKNAISNSLQLKMYDKSTLNQVELTNGMPIKIVFKIDKNSPNASLFDKIDFTKEYSNKYGIFLG